MAERLDRLSGDELETALRGVGQAVAYPLTEDVAARVARRLEALSATEPARLPFRRPSAAILRPLVRPAWHRVALAAAAAVLLAGAVLPFSPSARRAVADFLGLRGERINVVKSPPPATLRPLGEGLDLGTRMTLAE